ncbi:40-Residue YVTN family beta-propeller repeat protein (plasmid) [Arthrobacter sp. Hiyo8]|nr:40-Residue YVTN family beta-propeller repeat protein [Arthrobacter sp. Hiyo8]
MVGVCYVSADSTARRSMGVAVRFTHVLSLVFAGVLLLLGAGPSSASSGDTVIVGGTPLSVVIGPDGTAYIGDYSGGTLTSAGGGVGVLTAGASNPSEILTTGFGVAGLAVSADGTLFADGWDSAQRQELIGVIPKGAPGVTRTIPVTPGAHLIAAAPDGTVYVPNHDLNTVSVIPPGADAVSREIPVGAGPREVAVGKDGTAYVTSQEAGTVSVIPAGASSVSRSIQVSATPGTTDNPHGIALGPDGSLYVADITGNAVAVIKPGAQTWRTGCACPKARRSSRSAPMAQSMSSPLPRICPSSGQTAPLSPTA